MPGEIISNLQMRINLAWGQVEVENEQGLVMGVWAGVGECSRLDPVSYYL